MEKERYKIAICFFGLTRSLKYTLPSIKKNIFEVLKRNNISYDVYLHTYNLKGLTNKRSGEINCPLDTEEWKLLNPIAHKITNQGDFDNSFNWEMLFKHGDIWKDGYNSIKNALRQLNSLKEVTSLWRNKPKYDYYIYIRPDLYFVNEIDVNDIIQHINIDNIIVIPYWGNYRGGFNDRIAYGTYNVMQIYGNRINDITRYYGKHTPKKPYHSERYLTTILRNYHIFLRYCKLRAIRIRANGIYEDKDLVMFKRYLT